MNKKDLHKLKRSELLEIMLAQSEEIDRLRAEIAEKDKQLADRRIAISNSGSLAEASLQLTRIFVEAQTAADIYVANAKANADQRTTSAQTFSVPASGSTQALGTQSYRAASSAMQQSAHAAGSTAPTAVQADDDDDMPRGRHAHIPGRTRNAQGFGTGAR